MISHYLHTCLHQLSITGLGLQVTLICMSSCLNDYVLLVCLSRVPIVPMLFLIHWHHGKVSCTLQNRHPSLLVYTPRTPMQQGGKPLLAILLRRNGEGENSQTNKQSKKKGVEGVFRSFRLPPRSCLSQTRAKSSTTAVNHKRIPQGSKKLGGSTESDRDICRSSSQKQEGQEKKGG